MDNFKAIISSVEAPILPGKTISFPEIFQKLLSKNIAKY